MSTRVHPVNANQYLPKGWCAVHQGQGTKLNRAYPSGGVGQYYDLGHDVMVCEDCWKKVNTEWLNNE